MPSPHDVFSVPLTSDERHLLAAGLTEWGGPSHCTDELAVAMGFADEQDLFGQTDRLIDALRNESPLSAADWWRVLAATEIVFASDVFGSGPDWPVTTGLPDEVSIRLLRNVQTKMSNAGVTLAMRGGSTSLGDART